MGWTAFLQYLAEALGGGSAASATGATTAATESLIPVYGTATAAAAPASAGYEGALSALSGVAGGASGGSSGPEALPGLTPPLAPNGGTTVIPDPTSGFGVNQALQDAAKNQSASASSVSPRAAIPKAGVQLPANVERGPATFSQGTQPFPISTPSADPLAASQPVGAWDKFTSGLGKAWQGYQNLEIGPGASKLTPEERSQAFWGAKLAQLSTAAAGGNGPAARYAYGHSAVRNAEMDKYLGPLEAAATTPEEKSRVGAMRAFHTYIKPDVGKSVNATMLPISDSQEAPFQRDPATGKMVQVGPGVARFKPAQNKPRTPAQQWSDYRGTRLRDLTGKVSSGTPLTPAERNELSVLLQTDPYGMPYAVGRGGGGAGSGGAPSLGSGQ